MKQRLIGLALGTLLVTLSMLTAHAQQSMNIPRVGYLQATPPKTAKQIGLTIPPDVLARATKIIR